MRNKLAIIEKILLVVVATGIALAIVALVERCSGS